MKNMKRFLFFLLVSLLSVCSYAQQDTEFWFAAPYINCEHGSISPYRLVVFAFDKAGLESIADGQKCLIVAGQNLLVAKAVTKVLSTVADFFNDANGDGTALFARKSRGHRRIRADVFKRD